MTDEKKMHPRMRRNAPSGTVFNVLEDGGSNRGMQADAWDSIIDASSKSTSIQDIPDLNRGQRRIRIIIISIVCVVALLITGGALFFFHQVAQERSSMIAANSTVITTTPKTEKETEEKDASETGLSNPVASTKTIGTAVSGDVTMTVKGNAVTISSKSGSSKVSVPALTSSLTASSTGCDLTITAANCVLAQGKVSDKTVTIIGLRDAASSSLLYDTADPQSVGSSGAALAYVRNFTSDGSKVRGLVIVFKDQTGVIITSTDSATITAIAAGSSSFSATSTLS